MPHDPALARDGHAHAHDELARAVPVAPRRPAAAGLMDAPEPPLSLMRLSLGARLAVTALALLLLWAVVLMALR
ncbi:MAG: hypothetical protein EPO23_11355 [Xanthobacteraceae bacterium]|nr:MAG: hypothetical protein EPO23_11355 [Xanthobacteraceae bacterium]